MELFSSGEFPSATAFDSEQLAHLPFMELFSSGEFPFVVAARRYSSCAFSFDVGVTGYFDARIFCRGSEIS